jgi:peptide chain release factor 2
MDKNNVIRKLEDLLNEFNELKGILNLEEKNSRIIELESISQDSNFWSDPEYSKDILSELSDLKDGIKTVNDVDSRLKNALELTELDLNESELIELEVEVNNLTELMEKFKIETLLNEEFDKNNAYLEIHSGAGGTESNDWADMIYRMYTRYFEKKGFRYEIINEQPGEEVGIKGALIYVKGKNAFGLLKGETGVHRLVRISPFDSNKRRHTSFASVLITPEINKNMNIEVQEKDLKIDVYRSSGAGGQSVNTTDSAVRITHLPTGIVVNCQNERSQVKNKDKAMEILKTKLYILEQEKFNEKLKGLKGEVMDVNFGSAIRSYVMCPYTLVKDVRTEVETSNVEKILNGDLDIFIEGNLKKHNLK